MQNVILWMPNTVIILHKIKPFTPSSFSIIPTSCLSNISTGKNNILGYWSDPLHSLISLSQLFSYVMHNLRRSKTHLSTHCPRRFQPAPVLLGLQVLSWAPKTALVWYLMKMNPTAFPRTPEHWDAGHHKSRTRAEGLCFSRAWRPLACQPPLVVLNWDMQGK